MAEAKPAVEIRKLSYTLDELEQVSGVGRSSIYQSISDLSLPAKKWNGRTIVLAADAEKFLHNLPPFVPGKRKGQRRVRNPAGRE
ncbi:hypothetical protein [Mesorhizobium sp. IMUNJ 23232]|uniref:hypothetical protein n=1 Tax=Mesorhizobium sp. IMUNJ 23232 TaxID=3376064 RepID=UPI0037BDC158